MNLDPFDYPFPQRTDTMSLSTINQRDFLPPKRFNRESTFQKTDIIGTTPTKLDFTLSTYVEPGIQHRKINKISDPLKIDDIPGTQPSQKGFKTGRITDPLFPTYKLPSCDQMTVDNGREFIRDTLKVEDIAPKKEQYLRQRGVQILNEPIEGSKSKPLTHVINAVSRLKVDDINKEGVFQTKRVTNPLAPIYRWRDEQGKRANPNYGNIDRNRTQQKHPTVVNRHGYSNLNTGDIEGAQHNSYFQRSYFLGKRRDIRDYMKTNDIQNCKSSSLKKGITTQRMTNPLVPNYRIPGHSQPPK